MTVNCSKRELNICLLRKPISVPLGNGTGLLGKGELVTIISGMGDETTISPLMGGSQSYSCAEKHLKPVPPDVVDFLIPVMPLSKRYEVFSKLDKNLLTIHIGTHVNVTRGRTNPNLLCELKYRGEMKGRVGTWFGVKLINSQCGDSDGSVNGVYYMDKFLPNSVVFVTVDELSFPGTENSHSDSLSLLSNMGDIKQSKSPKLSSRTLPLRARKSDHSRSSEPVCAFGEGDEVVVLKNKVPAEGGVVRCVFQDAKKGWVLGIQLEHPVGDSNGRYKGQQMFQCDPKYGIFCDMSEAMPKHYYESPSNRMYNISPTTSNSTMSLPKNSSSHVRSASYGKPPSYEESFNNRATSSNNSNPDSHKSPKSPKPGTKTDFDQAFKQNTSSSNSSGIVSKLSSSAVDVVNSINTMTLAAADSMEESLHSPTDNNRADSRTDSRADSRTNKQSSPMTPEPPPDIDYSLEIGSMVQVSKNGIVHYGVLRWIGNLPNKKHLCAGLELEEEISPPGNDGMYDGVRYFTCPPQRALFCYFYDCKKDRRFEEMPVQPVKHYFGPHESNLIEGKVDPPKHLYASHIGRGRGIQGNKNSCYLDSTLFAMFAFHNSMDYLLSCDVKGDANMKIQRQLAEAIVNPLRDGGFVGAEHMRVLRDLMNKSSTLDGLETEEKEPEELLNVLFTEIFNIKPLLSFRHGATNEISHVNLCQILLERDPHSSTMPQTQDLLTRYFVSNNLYFHCQPELLLLQVPRSGKDFKVYDTVLPSTQLQLGGLCGGVWGNCYICNKTPHFKCPECYLQQEFKSKLSAVPYCESCCELAHTHPDRAAHKPVPATTPRRGIKMVLSAVLCIHTSHYVTYCRVPSPPSSVLNDVQSASSSSSSSDNSCSNKYCWVFFDSMADRIGGIGGYNIPQVEECPDLEDWLLNPTKLLHEQNKAPDFVKRLIKDALLCFYVVDKD